MRGTRHTSHAAALFGVAAGALLIVGCVAEAGPVSHGGGIAAGLSDGELEGSESNPETPVTTESLGAVSLVPEVELMVRARQRMNLDQLAAAIVRATGGLGWTEPSGSTESDLFEQLAPTLGKPDYVEITQEDLSPSALFHKFLDDAARSVCARLVEQETSAPSAPRALMVHVDPEDTIDGSPEAVDTNLRYLLLRFHGHSLPEEAGDGVLTHWRWLFQTVSHGSGEPADAWRAVCVALITHPDFYSY